jgi:hypothetical protein
MKDIDLGSGILKILPTIEENERATFTYGHR